MSPSVWILMLTVLPGQTYSSLQLEYLDTRKPWIVNDAAGIGVSLRLTSPEYGRRLVFRETISIDGKTQEYSQDIFAVPREGTVYWLNSKEMTAFEGLAQGIVSETINGDRICLQALMIATIALMLIYIYIRNYGFQKT